MVVVVTIAIGGLIFMTRAISSTSESATGNGAPDEATQQVDNPKDLFSNNCQTGAYGSVNCQCLTARLESAGYKSDEQWNALMTAISNASANPQSVAPPVDYQQALNACRV